MLGVELEGDGAHGSVECHVGSHWGFVRRGVLWSWEKRQAEGVFGGVKVSTGSAARRKMEDAEAKRSRWRELF